MEQCPNDGALVGYAEHTDLARPVDDFEVGYAPTFEAAVWRYVHCLALNVAVVGFVALLEPEDVTRRGGGGCPGVSCLAPNLGPVIFRWTRRRARLGSEAVRR